MSSVQLCFVFDPFDATPVSEVVWRSSTELFDCSQGAEYDGRVPEEGHGVDVTIPG